MKLTKQQIETIFSDATCDNNIFKLTHDPDEEYELTGVYEESLSNHLFKGGRLYLMNIEDYLDDCEIIGREKAFKENAKFFNLEDIEKAMDNALKICPQDVADLLSEHDDAITGFNLIQVIAYGDIIYG